MWYALLTACMYFFPSPASLEGEHPFYVSVATLEHNAAEKRLEISVRIFTDDFEQCLRKGTREKVDLLDKAAHEAMDTIVAGYINKHLELTADQVLLKMNYLGYQQEEEAVLIFLEAVNLPRLKKLQVKDDLLYECKKDQHQIIHLTVNGKRKSTRLSNPQSYASFSF
jgi:hypothetical protein